MSPSGKDFVGSGQNRRQKSRPSAAFGSAGLSAATRAVVSRLAQDMLGGGTFKAPKDASSGSYRVFFQNFGLAHIGVTFALN